MAPLITAVAAFLLLAIVVVLAGRPLVVAPSARMRPARRRPRAAPPPGRDAASAVDGPVLREDLEALVARRRVRMTAEACPWCGTPIAAGDRGCGGCGRLRRDEEVVR